MGPALRSLLVAAGRAIGAVVGVPELLVAVALWFIARGFLEFWAPGAYLAPGLVMLWLFLPQRNRFVTPAPDRRKES